MSDSDKQIFDSIGNVLAALLNVMRVLEHGSSFKKLMNIAHHKKDFESSKQALEDSSKNLIEISVQKDLDILKAQILGTSELCSRVIRNFQGTQFQELQEGLSLYCRAQEKLYWITRSRLSKPISPLDISDLN